MIQLKYLNVVKLVETDEQAKKLIDKGFKVIEPKPVGDIFEGTSEPAEDQVEEKAVKPTKGKGKAAKEETEGGA